MKKIIVSKHDLMGEWIIAHAEEYVRKGFIIVIK